MGEQNTPGEGSTPGEQNTPQPARRVSAVVVPLLGLIAVIVGVIVAWNNQQTTSFGWFAYAPLSDTVFMGNGMTMVSQGTQIGLAVTVLGLLVLAFWAGLRIGRDR
ncbi:hypothetical protein [Arthrobacter sp. 31Y]|uniref:hypothetical protein n=1 Tax=Arthrobacter sp. 31Y TaxID=1115632 RepID=UPI0004641053|nr:hypothetical protein [Arthrobacter sp. 31Y]